MRNGDDNKCVFPLTRLQIGDLQSYLSDLSIFLSKKSTKVYILVDNTPWLNHGIRSAHFWQLIVIMFRFSPFANTKSQGEKKKQNQEEENKPKEAYSQPNNKNLKKLKKLFSLITFSKKKGLAKKLQISSFLNKELRKNLYGFIVFEIELANVRGINYLNELQTDTSLAIESKLMRRWEFQNTYQAVTHMSHWFYGSKSEKSCLRKYLDSTIGDVSVSDGENMTVVTQHKDVLVLVKFDDPDLPFKLQDVIMADVRLLTLLEAGLPSWVLFLQSYPCFSHLYRPWMCLFARVLYVIISIITVLIGFYDLYKNVPILKTTATRLCGPLLDWVETWDMVSRIKYLGTMLFLHNFQKALKWGLKMARTMKSVVSLLVMPLVNPLLKLIGLLLPLWISLVEIMASLASVVWIVIESGCNLVGDVVDLVVLPIWWILSLVSNITNMVFLPLLWIIWEVVYAPIRMVITLTNCLVFSLSYIFDVLGDSWRYMNNILHLLSDSQATLKNSEISMWTTLWNILFKNVFRAVKSILNVFLAFFAVCNRHRLSIYNHIQDLIQKLHGRTLRSESIDSRNIKSAKKHNNRRKITRRKAKNGYRKRYGWDMASPKI